MTLLLAEMCLLPLSETFKETLACLIFAHLKFYDRKKLPDAMYLEIEKEKINDFLKFIFLYFYFPLFNCFSSSSVNLN